MANSTSMTELDLDAIEARANAAARGPWKLKNWTPRDGGRPQRMVMTKLGCLWNDWNGLNDEADGEFVCAARTDVPVLVAEVRRLRGEQS